MNSPSFILYSCLCVEINFTDDKLCIICLFLFLEIVSVRDVGMRVCVCVCVCVRPRGY